MVADWAFIYKMDYVIFLKEILNFAGHLNCIPGLKVAAILLKGWILPVGGVASGRV